MVREMREERDWNNEFKFNDEYRSYIRPRSALHSRGSLMNTKLFLTGFTLILVGMLLVSLAAVLSASAGTTSGVIITFPIPIGIAWGPHGMLLAIISLIIMLIMLIVNWMILRKYLP